MPLADTKTKDFAPEERHSHFLSLVKEAGRAWRRSRPLAVPQHHTSQPHPTLVPLCDRLASSYTSFESVSLQSFHRWYCHAFILSSTVFLHPLFRPLLSHPFNPLNIVFVLFMSSLLRHLFFCNLLIYIHLHQVISPHLPPCLALLCGPDLSVINSTPRCHACRIK